jgi:polyisoprenyl-phosphate glycosyltransferase
VRSDATRPDLSVVVPVFRNTDTLVELHRRVAAALDANHIAFELLFVNDASPDDSTSVIERISAIDPRVKLVALERNVGQHPALMAGIRRADAAWTALLDADLQDPPEALPQLLRLAESGYDAVFAGRRGHYQSWPRLLTGRMYRRLLRLLTGLPADAGAFLVMSVRMRQFLLSAGGPRPFIVSMIGCSGMPVLSVPVPRAMRTSGRSTYSTGTRVRAGIGALTWITWWKLRGRRRARLRRLEIEFTPPPQ